MRKQAERCNRSKVDLHIERQRRLGERMIGDHDLPSARELIGSAVIIALLLAYGKYQHITMPWDLMP